MARVSVAILLCLSLLLAIKIYSQGIVWQNLGRFMLNNDVISTHLDTLFNKNHDLSPYWFKGSSNQQLTTKEKSLKRSLKAQQLKNIWWQFVCLVGTILVFVFSFLVFRKVKSRTQYLNLLLKRAETVLFKKEKQAKEFELISRDAHEILRVNHQKIVRVIKQGVKKCTGLYPELEAQLVDILSLVELSFLNFCDSIDLMDSPSISMGNFEKRLKSIVAWWAHSKNPKTSSLKVNSDVFMVHKFSTVMVLKTEFVIREFLHVISQSTAIGVFEISLTEGFHCCIIQLKLHDLKLEVSNTELESQWYQLKSLANRLDPELHMDQGNKSNLEFNFKLNYYKTENSLSFDSY